MEAKEEAEQARMEAEAKAETEAKAEQARLEAEAKAEADKARQEEEKRKAEESLLAAQKLFVETVPETQVDDLGDVPHDDVQNDTALVSETDLDNLLETPRAANEPDLDDLLETPRANAPSLDDLLDDEFDESVFNDSSSDDTATGKPSDKSNSQTTKQKNTMVSRSVVKPKAQKRNPVKPIHSTRVPKVAIKSREKPPPPPPPTKIVTTTSNKNTAKSIQKPRQPNIFVRRQTPGNRRLQKPPASLQSPRSIDSSESHCTISTIPRSPLMPLSEDESCEVCDNTYMAKLHHDKLGCQVCIFKLSHAERERYETAGRHLRVAQTSGGCLDCKVFPSEEDEEPVRLCKQCFFDTHLIAMRKEKAFTGNGSLMGIQNGKRAYSPGRRRYR
mmetsp:Transcript_15054/g.32279  ORF Transcript_15054/g.32279 Transcript_15054/m.32279 type:complete len:388 (+) Transcript_15054:1-1164(+)